MRKIVHVVSGVMVRRHGDRDEVLLGLRPIGSTRPDLWEFPGGKREPGETARGALAREWLEELGAAVLVGARVATATLDLVDTIFEVELYEVSMCSGETPSLDVSTSASAPSGLIRLHHADLRWVDPRYAVTSLPCSPGYYLHYPYLMAWLARRGRPSQRSQIFSLVLRGLNRVGVRWNGDELASAMLCVAYVSLGVLILSPLIYGLIWLLGWWLAPLVAVAAIIGAAVCVKCAPAWWGLG